jgi:hypothetical protein
MIAGVSVPRVITPLLLVLVIAMRRSQQAIIEALERDNARSAESARSLAGLWWLKRLMLQRLMLGGAIKIAPGDRYYIDWDGYTAFRRRRRVRAVATVGIVVAVAALIWWRTGT